MVSQSCAHTTSRSRLQPATPYTAPCCCQDRAQHRDVVSPVSTVRAGSPALRRPSKARRWVIQAAGGEKLSDTHLGVGQSQPCSPRFISRCFAFLLGKGTALGPSATGKGREGHAGRVPPYLSNAIQVKTLPGIRGKSHGTLTWRPVSNTQEPFPTAVGDGQPGQPG